MYSVVFIGAILATAFQTVNLQLTPGLCDGWRMVNGAGYNNHPTDCDKYVQCHYDGQGVLFGEVQQCAFSTYWYMDLLTCLPVKEANCSNDKCANKIDGTIFGAEGNCRGYWRCAGGLSEPMCCPFGQRYDHTLECIDDLNLVDQCTDTCFNDNSTVQETCADKRDAGIPGMFEQQVEGWGWIRMHCAPGTVFLKSSCRCEDRMTISTQRLACRPEVYLPFTSDHNDASGNGYYVANENVQVLNGVASFNGVNSRLIIPRFTNLDHSTKIFIKVMYSSNHSSTSGAARALVSNGACGSAPTIMISEDNSNIYFGVGTSNKTLAYVNVQQLNMGMKDILYAFDNGMLRGSNGVNESSVSATGFLRNAQCALHVGDGQTNLNSFKGEIDELTVYLCNPEARL